MKKLLGLMLGLFLTVTTFANGIVTYSDVATAGNSKSIGVFNFSFDSSFSIDEINKTAKYYTNYFTVKPVKSGETINVNIALTDDNDMARRVITRFFVSLNVKTISVNGKDIKIDEFIKEFVMK